MSHADTPDRPARARRAVAPRPRSTPEPDPEAQRRTARDLALQRQTRLGIASIAVCLAAGVAALLYWRHAESAAEEAIAARGRAETALRAEILAASFADGEHAERAVRRLEAMREHWRDWPSASEFEALLSKATAGVQAARSAGAIGRSLEELEQLVDTSPTDASAWLEIRERATAIAPSLATASEVLQQRMRACVERIDDGCIGALRAAIGDTALDAGTRRSHAVAAQELATARADAAKGARDAAARTRWEDELRTLVEQENALVASTYDAATIAALPWLDLLPGTRAEHWMQSSTPGLRHEVTGDTLAIDAEDSGDERRGVVALSGHTWRHCALAFDVTMPRGAVTILLRSGKRANPGSAAAVKLSLVDAEHAVPLPADRSVAVEMLLLGDRLVVTAGDARHTYRVPLAARSGGLALIVEPGTSVRLTHLRVKNLP